MNEQPKRLVALFLALVMAFSTFAITPAVVFADEDVTGGGETQNLVTLLDLTSGCTDAGVYEEDDRIVIFAGYRNDGQFFNGWEVESGDVQFETSTYGAITYFNTPDNNVEIKATWYTPNPFPMTLRAAESSAGSNAMWISGGWETATMSALSGSVNLISGNVDVVVNEAGKHTLFVTGAPDTGSAGSFVHLNVSVDGSVSIVGESVRGFLLTSSAAVNARVFHDSISTDGITYVSYNEGGIPPARADGQFPLVFPVTVSGSGLAGSALSGEGSFPAMHIVAINAGTQDGYTFSHWTGTSTNGSIVFDDSTSSITTFSLPTGAAIVTANWMNVNWPDDNTITTVFGTTYGALFPDIHTPGTFSWEDITTSDTTTVGNVGTYTRVLTFEPTDMTFATVSRNITIKVGQADPTVNTLPTATVLYGNDLSTAVITGGDTTPAEGSWTMVNGTDIATVTASHPARFTPENDNYKPIVRNIHVEVIPSFAVTFELNGGNVSGNLDSVVARVASGQSLDIKEVPITTQSGFIMTGWLYNDVLTTGASLVAALSNVTEDRALTAQWEEVMWAVTFDANGGHFTSGSALTVTAASLIFNIPDGTDNPKAPKPTREFHYFRGWLSNVDGATSSMSLGVIDRDITFTAQWEIYEYEVVFKLKGGTYAGDQELLSQTVKHGEAASALTSDPTLLGFTFQGWTLKQTGAEVATGSALEAYLSSVTGGSLTFIARWHDHRVDPTVVWPEGLTAIFGTQLGSITITPQSVGGSNTPGTFSWTSSPEALVGNAGSQYHNLTFIPDDLDYFNVVTRDALIVVTPASPPAIQLPTPSAIIIEGQPLSSVNLILEDGKAPVYGVWTWANPDYKPGFGTTTANALLTIAEEYAPNYAWSELLGFGNIGEIITITTSISITVLPVHEVTFDLNGGTIDGSSLPYVQFVTHGSFATSPAGLVAPDGWSLVGWVISPASIIVEIGEYSITQAVTFTALWEYDVKFDTNFGSNSNVGLVATGAEVLLLQRIRHGATATAIDAGDIFLLGHTLEGWKLEGTEGTLTGASLTAELSNINGPKTFIAVWHDHRVDPTVPWPTDLTAVYDDDARVGSIALSSPEGLTVTGGSLSWESPEDFVGSVGTQNHNMTFTPALIMPTAGNTLNPTGNWAHYYNSVTTAVAIAVTPASAPDVESPTPSASIIEHQRLDTVDLVGGSDFGEWTWVSPDAIAVRGMTTAAAILTLDEYHVLNFDWSAIPGFSSEGGLNLTVTRVIDITVRPLHTVTFVFDEGEHVEGELTQQVADGDAAIPPTIIRHGYDITWVSSPAGMSIDNITGDITFVAEWSLTTWTVTFDPGVGANYILAGEELVRFVSHGSLVTPPAFGDTLPHGYTFGGWVSVATDMALDNITDNVTFEAKWEPVTWTVTFYADGGHFTSGDALVTTVTREVLHGHYVSDVPMPTRELYSLVGWHWLSGPSLVSVTAESLGVITNNTTATALWLPYGTVILNPSTISIDDNNLSQIVFVTGTAVGNITIDIPSPWDGFITAVVSSAASSATSGVAIEVTGVRPTTKVDPITGEFAIGVTRQNAKEDLTVNVNLTADYTPTITLDPTSVAINDNNLTPSVAVQGTAEGNVTLEAVTLPDGFTATEGGATVTVSYNDTTVFTATVVNGSTINFDATRPDTDVPPILGDIEIDVTREGITETLPVNVNLTSTWQPTQMFSITVNGGTVRVVVGGDELTSAEVEAGTEVRATAGEAPEGEQFARWNVSTSPAGLELVGFVSNSAITTFTMPSGNVTLTAEWEPIPYGAHSITKFGDGTDYFNVVANALPGTEVTLTLIPREDFTFDRWEVRTTSPAGFVNVTTDNTFMMPDSPVVVEAFWTQNMYEVVFDLVDGIYTGGGNLNQIVAHGDPAVLPEFTAPPGFEFAGWQSSVTGVTHTSITADVTFTAQWDDIPVQQHTVTFDLTGGVYNGQSIVERIVNDGGDATDVAPIPTKDGYIFMGWSASITNITGSITVYAQWMLVERVEEVEAEITVGGFQIPMDVTVHTLNVISTTSSAFTSTVVTVNITGAPANSTFKVQTIINFTVRVNPFVEVKMPVVVSVTTDENGNGQGYVTLTEEMIADFACESLGVDNVEVIGSTGADLEDGVGVNRISRGKGDLDVTTPGRITSSDATMLATWLLYQGEINTASRKDMIMKGFCLDAANLVGGEEITIADLIFLQQWLVGVNNGPSTNS